jgi:deoxyribose-phosphate aldolase
MSVVTITVTQTGMYNSVQRQTVNVPANYVHTSTGKSDGANYAPQISIMQTLYESNKLHTRTKQTKKYMPQQNKISVRLDIHAKQNKVLTSTGKAMSYITKDKTAILKFLSP